MRLTTLDHGLKKASSMLDELDGFFLTVPSVAWSGKKAFLAWLATPQGAKAVEANLGWPLDTLVHYIEHLKGLEWSSLVRAYR